MSVLHVNTQEFNSAVKENKLVVADFYATWCGPCKMIAPILEELSEKYEESVKVLKIDIDKETELTASFGIMSVPTVLIFKDGELASTETGARPLDYYVEKVEEFL